MSEWLIIVYIARLYVIYHTADTISPITQMIDVT